MTNIQGIFTFCALVLVSACSNKDREVTTGKSTALDKFEFKPRSAAETAAPASTAASAPRTALDSFVFKPRSAAEMSKPRPVPPGTPPSALDKFVFIPRQAPGSTPSPR